MTSTNRIRPLRVAGVTIAVMLLVMAVSIAFGHGRLNGWLCGGTCGPEAVAAPKGLDVPGSVDDHAPTSALPSEIDRDAVEDFLRAQGPTLAPLGRVSVSVADFTGETVTYGDGGGFVPASTTKLFTGFAALSLYSPEHRFVTRAVLSGGDVVLIGGGDPYLDVADTPGAAHHASLTDLADRSAAALKKQGVGQVRLGYDASLFEGPDFAASWKPSYREAKVIAPVSALSIDGSSAGSVAQQFAGLLAQRGIAVSAVVAATAPTEDAQLATVTSGTVAQIVESVEVHSDNQAAETLLRHVAIAGGEEATFDGGATAVADVLGDAGIRRDGVTLLDGSGLSRNNRVTATSLTSLLVAAARGQDTSRLISSLPIAGVSGTQKERLAKHPQLRGLVRAKTGTLDGVHAVAGVLTTADHHSLVFTVMTDQVPDALTGFAIHAIIDDFIAALVTCDCGSAP